MHTTFMTDCLPFLWVSERSGSARVVSSEADGLADGATFAAGGSCLFVALAVVAAAMAVEAEGAEAVGADTADADVLGEVHVYPLI
jgi:hypothetical protein